MCGIVLFVSNSNADIAASENPAPKPIESYPDNSILLERLEKIGASYELREALNNPITLEYEKTLADLLDSYDVSDSGDSKEDILYKINNIIIPGTNEGLPGEIQKNDAIKIAFETFQKEYNIGISKENDIIIQYMAADLYDRNYGNSFWQINCLKNNQQFYIAIDAATGQVFSFSCVEK